MYVQIYLAALVGAGGEHAEQLERESNQESYQESYQPSAWQAHQRISGARGSPVHGSRRGVNCGLPLTTTFLERRSFL